MKRICLFAAYNRSDHIEPYVYDYLKELSKYADIYYMADGTMDENNPCIGELLKICKEIFFIQHGKYDFGSYSELAKEYVGWETIAQYDELIFTNDSNMCVQDFKKVFDKMDAKECDAWGLLATDELNYDYQYTLEEYFQIPSTKVPLFCIGSYFIVLRKNVIHDLDFQNFVNSVSKETDRLDVCIKYEMGLTRFLKKKNYKVTAFVDVVYKNVIIYNEESIKLLKRGFPLVKVKTFTENPMGVKHIEKLPSMIEKYTNSNKIMQYVDDLNLVDLDLLNSIDKPSRKFVLFFNVAADTIGGGMLSINRFINKSMELLDEKNSNVILSGLPLSNQPVNYTMFESDLPMIHFDIIAENIYPEELVMHIPEFYLPAFIENLSDTQRDWLKKIPYLHINIMDQNHDFFPDRLYFEICKSYTDKVTITTAHSRYTTQEIAEEVDCPIKLLTPFLPEFYRTTFEEKEKVIAVSPDEFVFDGISKKDEALNYLRAELSDYEVVIIWDLTLEEYKKLISKALFTITFGEGYDGYYIEPFLSDSVAFAVYNETFFPHNFKDAPTVYESYKDFMENIVKDIRDLEKDGEKYKEYSDVSEKLTKEITNDEISLKNLKDFYDDKYDFIPEVCERSGYYGRVK